MSLKKTAWSLNLSHPISFWFGLLFYDSVACVHGSPMKWFVTCFS